MIEQIGEPAMLELLAEECTELAHAALKLARVERGENPTPKPLDECREKVVEEWADVRICIEEIVDLAWVDYEIFEKYYDAKRKRFQKRVDERRGHEA